MVSSRYRRQQWVSPKSKRDRADKVYWGKWTHCLSTVIRLTALFQNTEGPQRSGFARMPRARNLKPAFFTNEQLLSCEPLARLLFQGLWCLADREGRLEDRPLRIKIQILPTDDCDTDALLNQLNDLKLIRRYMVDGEKYICIPKFLDHQKPHKHESPSKIPMPKEVDDRQPLAAQGRADDETRPLVVGLNPSFLNEESLSSESLPSAERNGAPRSEQETRFEEFWKAYPRRTARKEALRAWKRIKVDDPFLEKILAAIEKQKQSDQWLKNGGQFIPHPATWLNQGRWEDEIQRGVWDGKRPKQNMRETECRPVE